MRELRDEELISHFLRAFSGHIASVKGDGEPLKDEDIPFWDEGEEREYMLRGRVRWGFGYNNYKDSSSPVCEAIFKSLILWEKVR
jgi:hypothetical protein